MNNIFTTKCIQKQKTKTHILDDFFFSFTSNKLIFILLLIMYIFKYTNIIYKLGKILIRI